MVMVWLMVTKRYVVLMNRNYWKILFIARKINHLISLSFEISVKYQFLNSGRLYLAIFYLQNFASFKKI